MLDASIVLGCGWRSRCRVGVRLLYRLAKRSCCDEAAPCAGRTRCCETIGCVVHAGPIFDHSVTLSCTRPDRLRHAPHRECVNVLGATHMVAGDRNDHFGKSVIEVPEATGAGGRQALSPFHRLEEPRPVSHFDINDSRSTKTQGQNAWRTYHSESRPSSCQIEPLRY
jgi:hypothetical protein